MAIGGLLNGRRVAETMSKKLVPLAHEQGSHCQSRDEQSRAVCQLVRITGFNDARLCRLDQRHGFRNGKAGSWRAW